MREYVRIAFAASAAAVLIGASYLISGQSTAHSYSERSAPSRIDVFALMVASKDLPSQQYDIS
jgi:hypothetical protein